MDAEKLGADHTDALMAKMNLATLLKNQGKTAEAEALYQEVIAGYTEKLGADHTDTLDAKMNLATLLKYQGKTAEAEALYQEVIIRTGSASCADLSLVVFSCVC